MKYLFLLTTCTFFNLACSQRAGETDKVDIVFEINPTVVNQGQEYFNDIMTLWKEYLFSDKYFYNDNEYWDQSMYPIPDMSIGELLFYLRRSKNENIIHCTLMGIVPLGNNYYDIKSIFHQYDENEKIVFTFYTSVICRNVNNHPILVSKPQYLKKSLNLNRIDKYIDFYTRRNVEFNSEDATKMVNFNTELSELFGTHKLSFEVFRNSTTQETFKFRGTEFAPSSFYHIQISGRADVNNKIIYSSNNSEFYPHELVHFYIEEVAETPVHRFVDEGIATLLGGSADESFRWHKNKLKEYLLENPDFAIPQIDNISGYLPNGEDKTILFFVIAATICEEIYSDKGIDGLKSAINCGNTDEQLFNLIESELGVKKDQIPIYLSNKILEFPKDTTM